MFLSGFIIGFVSCFVILCLMAIVLDKNNEK